MNYTNVKNGLGYVFLAEILTLIGGFSGIFGDSVIGIILNLLLSILTMVAFFVTLTGLKLAGMDEPEYLKARKWAILGIIICALVDIIGVIFPETNFSNYATEINGFCVFLVAYMVLRTSSRVLRAAEKESVAVYADKTAKLYLAAFIASEIFGVLAAIFNQSLVALIPAMLGTVALVLLFIAQIKYILFLNKATKALNGETV